MSLSLRAHVGHLVLYPNAIGIARIGAIDGPRLKLEMFESAAQPVVGECWVSATDVRRHRLGVQTRVYWRDVTTGAWQAGRVVGGGPDEYFVRVPNADSDIRVNEADLRVRWDRPVADPLQVLLAGAQESPSFRDARVPVLRSHVVQRAACASVPAVVSSRVQLHAHQIETATRVLGDPVQRYLLADEVGLGKTIETGFVIRQRFLDDPQSKVVVIAPDSLRRQWRDEMVARFFVDDFPAGTFKIGLHEAPQTWERYTGFDLVVIDEAHQLVGTDPAEHPYQELRALCHAVPRLLLLSATPVLHRETTHLGLLHLLDPDLYRWEELEPFRQRLAVRRELARAMYALDPEFPFLLPDALNDVRELLPPDRRFEELAGAVASHLDAEGNVVATDDRASLARAVEGVRGHVGETYRLHRRVIRHRRATVVGAELDDEALLPAFEVTGRRCPKLVSLSSLEHQAAVRALEDWQVAVRDAALDAGTDPAPYVAVFAVLASRTGGPADDLRAALRWRLSGDDEAARAADLSKDERRALAAAPVQPAERAIANALDDLPECDGLAEIMARLAPAAGARAVIFAGPGSLGPQVSRALVRGKFAGAVREHIAAAGAEDAEAAVAAWSDRGGVLVCDSSADDGRNFQLANLVVHLRLPADPNTLEQRIGRVDRYGSERPAQQVVFSDDTATVIAAWRKLLVEGYRVFDRSISALQDAVARDLDAVWASALADGVEGMAAMRATIEKTLSDELRSVAQLDMLEASYDADHHTRNLALDMARYELATRGDRDPLLRLVGGDDGFRMFVRRRQNGRVDVEPAAREPLMSPRLLARLRAVPPPSRSAYIDRWLALKNGGRLFRIGNPLVDAVAEILELDDRGRASAHWRVDRSWESDPLAYFGFVYLVEASVTAALRVIGDRAVDDRPLRRRADRSLPPFTRSVWIPADTYKAVEDKALVAWLEAPYRNDDGDVNLSQRRVGPLHALFGGERGFAASTTGAEAAARAELARVTDLRTRCDAAAETLRKEGAVLAAQAEARSAAGRLLGDDESLVLDRNLNDALVSGTAAPDVRLIAVTCLVRSRRRWSPDAS